MLGVRGACSLRGLGALPRAASPLRVTTTWTTRMTLTTRAQLLSTQRTSHLPSQLIRPFSATAHCADVAAAAAPPAADGSHTLGSFDPLNEQLDAEARAILQDPDMSIGYLYFDSVFPIRLGWWDIRGYIASAEQGGLLERIRSSLPEDAHIGHGFKVLSVQERKKDGGAFLCFAYNKTDRSGDGDVLGQIEQTIKGQLRKGAESSWLVLFNKPSVHVVRGKPWREDMHRFPATTLKVEIKGGDVNEERIWELLRVYGRIRGIEKKPNEALVGFTRMRGATAARNCAHGMKLPEGATLVINYQPKLRSKTIWDWASSHPRMMFPLVLTLLGTITWLIFDPIRAWCVEQKVERTFVLDKYRLYKWIKEKTVTLLGDRKEKEEAQDIWYERKQAAREIAGLLRETPSTFITIAGPKGSGKGQLLESTLATGVLSLEIDCDAIAKAGKSDAALVNALATETGYWPVMSWLNSLNNLIDLAAVGLIGSKAGFAAPVDAQLKQVLSVVGTALARTNVKEQRKAEKKAKKAARERGSASDGRSDDAQAKGPSAAALAAAAATAPASKETLIDTSTPADTKAEAEKKGTPAGITSTITSGVRSVADASVKSVTDAGSIIKSTLLGGESEAQKKEAAAEAAIEKEKAEARRSRDELLTNEHLSEDISSTDRRRIPVVVIKNYHHKGIKNPVLWATLAEWSAELVANGVAHVVFVSDNPAAMGKELTKALPNRPFEGVLLADADELRARRIVAAKLREIVGEEAPVDEQQPSSVAEQLRKKREELARDKDDKSGGLSPSAQEAVDKLGGRLTDLETVSRATAVSCRRRGLS